MVRWIGAMPLYLTSWGLPMGDDDICHNHINHNADIHVCYILYYPYHISHTISARDCKSRCPWPKPRFSGLAKGNLGFTFGFQIWNSHIYVWFSARPSENVYIVYQPRRRPNIVQSLVGVC